MPYLTNSDEIRAYINKISKSKILWLDTEVSGCYSRDKELSLIQVLDDPDDKIGKNAYVLDVLDRGDLAALFVNQIMKNFQIEKVFHNASFDVKYLGGKELVKNVTCTYAMARKNKHLLSHCLDLKLKTLAMTLCNFNAKDIYESLNEQTSDWGRRPLTAKQLWYAQMDVVYLAQVHQRLQTICKVKTPPYIGRLTVNSNQIRSTVAPKSVTLVERIVPAPTGVAPKPKTLVETNFPPPENAGIEWLVRFGLPGQILACFNQSQIKTIAELQMRGDSQFLNIKGFDRSYLNNVKLSLKAYNQAWQKQQSLSKAAPQSEQLEKKITPTSVIVKQNDQKKKEAGLFCQDVPLRSAVGINYTKLRDLLATGEWRLADKETGMVISVAAQMAAQMAGLGKKYWHTVKDIDIVPCEDLRTINQLWIKYSHGRFGFSVQKDIYESLGGTKEYNEEIWDAFSEVVGWRKDGEYLEYLNYTFNLTGLRGHLPWIDIDFGVEDISHLTQRLSRCGISLNLS